MRCLALKDRFISLIDQGLRVSLGGADAIERTQRPIPAPIMTQSATDTPDSASLSPAEAQLSAKLMRINHAGEVAAQALYFGQALMAQSEELREFLRRAAREEGDHLYWCAERLSDLNARPSYLTPLWFFGSAAIGVLAASRSDAISLGFINETERQVEGHINHHLERLPVNDFASRAVLEQMRSDEAQHASDARERGASGLPVIIQKLMTQVSKVMTFTAGRI